MATPEDEREADFEQWLDFFKLALDGAVNVDLDKIAAQLTQVAGAGGEVHVTTDRIGVAIARLAGSIADGAVAEVRRRRNPPSRVSA